MSGPAEGDPPKGGRPIRSPLPGQTDRRSRQTIVDYKQSAGVNETTAWADGALVSIVDPFDQLFAEMDGFSAENLPRANTALLERLRKISAVVTTVASDRGDPNPTQLGMTWVALTVVCGEGRFADPLSLNRYAGILGVSTQILSRRIERMSRLLKLPNPCECSIEHRENLSAARREVIAKKARAVK